MKTQAEIREELKRIREDPNLSEDEKRKRSQGVLATITTVVELTSNYSKECPHYQKKCSRFTFDCCKIIDPCNRCHQARECCKTHPPQVSSITCDECETVQEPSPNCTSCGVQFSKSHCSICKIWTALDIVHCNECGICRVGKPGENFHCTNCDACFSLASRASHVCARIALKNERCCYCLESVHTSQKSSVITHCCGIGVHDQCIRSAAKHGNYRCPRCRKSIFDMTNAWNEIRFSIAAQPLPDDMFELETGLMFNTVYGPFRIDQVVEVTRSIKSLSSSSGSSNSSSSSSGSSGNSSNGSSSGSHTTAEGAGDASSGSVVSCSKLYCGALVDWVLSDGTCARATLNAAAIERRERLVHVWCNECELKSLTPFHFLGLECSHCRGFNTCKA